MLISISISIAIGVLLARIIESIFLALVRTVVANYIYYKPLLIAFVTQLKHFKKRGRTAQ